MCPACHPVYPRLQPCVSRLQQYVSQDAALCTLHVPQAFANVEGLLDRLAKYLRARLPQLRQIHEMHREGMKIH